MASFDVLEKHACIEVEFVIGKLVATDKAQVVEVGHITAIDTRVIDSCLVSTKFVRIADTKATATEIVAINKLVVIAAMQVASKGQVAVVEKFKGKSGVLIEN